MVENQKDVELSLNQQSSKSFSPLRMKKTSSLKLKDILLVYKFHDQLALSYTKEFILYLIESSYVNSIYLEELENFEDLLACDTVRLKGNPVRKFEQQHVKNISLAIVLGGDGTVLWTNHLFNLNPKPPFLTFNLGTLGYLAYYKCNDYKKVLTELFENKDRIISMESRSTIDVRFIPDERQNSDSQTMNCLNEISIEKGNGTHMISLKVSVNEIELSNIKSDGVMVSTSTGSTAYSLSAGGNIMHYGLDCLILNSMCPHTLSFRPIVFPLDFKIRVTVNQNSPDAVVCNDGIGRREIKQLQSIEVVASPYNVDIIILENLIENPLTNWKNKIVNTLGWNNSFKYN